MTRSQATPESSQMITMARMLSEKDDEIEQLRTQLAAAQAVIKEAVVMVEHWSAYADTCFRTKWHLDDDLAFLRAADNTVLRDRLRQERERCAKVCEANGNPGADGWSCAAKIRSMGDE